MPSPHLNHPLMTRIARGEPGAAEEAVDLYGSLVWSLARRYCASSADAEESVHEIFVLLWQRADRYNASLGAEITFVSIIARRYLIDRHRRLTTRSKHELEGGQVGLQRRDAASNHQIDSSQILEHSDDARQAAHVLQELGEDQREVLRLSIAFGQTHEQIAELKGLPVGTVKTHLRRGLAAIRDRLGLTPEKARVKP
jgi:RNA polymerase sigma factor (sigma-70 family)